MRIFSILLSLVLCACASAPPAKLATPAPIKPIEAKPEITWQVRELPRPITRDPALVKAPETAPLENDEPVMAQALKPVTPETITTNPDSEGGLLVHRVLYYDTDSSALPQRYRAVVAAHAHFIKVHPKAHVVLSGHCDERGSHEYNLSLGDRRALGIRQLMILSGVDAERIHTQSFGKERPNAQGHDEQAWARNRRVEIRYGEEP